MTQALTTFINDAGWLAPLYYVGSFLLAALLPFIPTPLIGALGGKAFGFLPALTYGVIGLGLGAFTALNLARNLGRPMILWAVKPEAWREWEKLLGIQSVTVWGVMFFILNLDIVVVFAGLTSLPLKQLWLAAIIARLPWLVVSAWFGDAVLVSDTVMFVTLLVFIPLLYGLHKLRPWLRSKLLIWGRK